MGDLITSLGADLGKVEGLEMLDVDMRGPRHRTDPSPTKRVTRSRDPTRHNHTSDGSSQ